MVGSIRMVETEHCSAELYNAMKGECPAMSYMANAEHLESRTQCDWASDTHTAMAYSNYSDHREHVHAVTYEKCKKLMLEAMDPVRRDYLLERGLIDDLKKTT